MPGKLEIRNPQDIVGITQDLVRIPSYGNLESELQVNEKRVAGYVYGFLNEYTKMSVKKQVVDTLMKSQEVFRKIVDLYQ